MVKTLFVSLISEVDTCCCNFSNLCCCNYK